MTTERFFPTDRVKPKQLKALRQHVRDELRSAPWLPARRRTARGDRGTVRNLAAAAMLAEELPSYGVQGFSIARDARRPRRHVSRNAPPPSAARCRIKPERADLILAGAVVVQTVMDVGGFDAMEVTEAGLRKASSSRSCSAATPCPCCPTCAPPPCATSPPSTTRRPPTPSTSPGWRWRSGTRSPAPVSTTAREDERELLWAAAILHDVGTAIDYDDHHKHSRYLILNAGLPGFSPRETALIGQSARYHRKGQPGMREFAPLAQKGDEELLARCAAILRIAEQLERPRDQTVRHADVVVEDGHIELLLRAKSDVTVSRWGAQRQGDLFERAFGKGSSSRTRTAHHDDHIAASAAAESRR